MSTTSDFSDSAMISGPQRPAGTVSVSGAKNAATRMMAASLLTDEPVTLLNFPTTLVDVLRKAEFMRGIGCGIDFFPEEDRAIFHGANVTGQHPKDLNCPIRTTYLLAAGQLHRNGVAYVPYPGGCRLGERKYDLHLMVWESLGCKVELKPDHIEIKGRLTGGDIRFPISTVGGTENALLCAVVAEGETTISNAYVTPEIANLIELLRLMGAEIEMAGLSRMRIAGRQVLRGATATVIPDRIEALTWMVWAAISGGDVTIENVPFRLMEIPLVHLREAGLDFFANTLAVAISPQTLGPCALQPFELACGTYPGVISDMQPFFVMLGLHADGRSVVYDYRYPDRTAYLEQLAKIYDGGLQWERGRIAIEGPCAGRAAQVQSTDLRGSMALLMAAFQAEGTTKLDKIHMALRGYDKLMQKLVALGLKIDLGRPNEAHS